jgi:hypothetical protein
MTQAKVDQIAESASPLVHWLGNILAEGTLPYRVRDEAGTFRDIVHEQDPALARADPLRIHATAHQKHLKAPAFWQFLDDHGIATDEKARKAAGRFRRFPLDEARARFTELHPWWQFDDDQVNWRMPDEVVKQKDQWLRIENAIAREEQEEEAVK